jgi:hypothetical protein
VIQLGFISITIFLIEVSNILQSYETNIKDHFNQCEQHIKKIVCEKKVGAQ